MRINRFRAQSGATLIEVLVSMLIIAFGLLGMAGLQARMQLSEVEAYQRSQALELVNDMASRIATNRLNASAYVTAAVGTGTADCTALTATNSQAQSDLRQWCGSLQGAGEFTGTSATASNSRGAMVGGRGCVTLASDGDYMVTVAWQGLTPISAPPSSVTCGSGSYNDSATCLTDLCRRVVTTVVRIASLT
ncbi:MAG: type IV pilus modification protein PilV [Ramlibacter sp.]